MSTPAVVISVIAILIVAYLAWKEFGGDAQRRR